MEIAVNAASKGKRVMICSAEMTRLQYTQRIMARLTGIPLDHIINGDIGDQQWQLVGDMASEIAKMSDGFLTDTYAIETLQSIVDANPPDLLIVDYLQLLDTKRRTENENIRLGVISTTIKRMAVSNNIPVLSLSQLSRQEGRAAVMPILKDLRGSGSIEQDADTVIFLHNPEAPSDKSVRDNDKDMCRLCLDSAGKPGEKRYIVVNVAKQRQGRRLAMFPLIFEPEVMRFTQIDRRA
jgi:replicative DNA helicase